MVKKKPASNQSNATGTIDAQKPIEEYWEEQRQIFGSTSFFVDSAAILSCLVPKDDFFRVFLEREIEHRQRFYTSSHVVAETARRLAKPNSRYPFRGPSDEKGMDLAVHFINRWLPRFGIQILCIPSVVFQMGRHNMEMNKGIEGWDLTDAISSIIVKGMGQKYIVSADKGFLQVGLMLMPSESWAKYKESTWIFE